MLYLVGGASRSGKSLLAERMCRRHGVPWFPLDALKMALHRSAPDLGVHPDDDDLSTADAMWSSTETLLDHLVFEARDYLVEGVNLRPATVAAYIADTDVAVRACFLGYPDVDLTVKMAAVADFAGPPTDWLMRTGRDHVAHYLDVSRTLSRTLRAECATFGLPFVDTGGDFAAALTVADDVLMMK